MKYMVLFLVMIKEVLLGVNNGEMTLKIFKCSVIHCRTFLFFFFFFFRFYIKGVIDNIVERI